MKIVLDTNCLVVALPHKSPYYWLWEAFRNREIILCYTTDILFEYDEILSRFYPAKFVNDVINELLHSKNVKQTNNFFRWHLMNNDPDDHKFVDCALNADADYIVTNDRHFNILKTNPFPTSKVVDINSFRQIIGK
ncbi:MAG: putative toxin-antitoxin system toxin component, PIN family [Dysgonamonadaceae bacterium]|jgi:putative PIN family toxin of toxin-antitoxin system|nr:putative toxin-antitoxin system toxin component, PIN family [Dysgonamonadaceae bacterium]